MNIEQQQARIDNIHAAEAGNRQYLRRIRVRDYLAGQAIYNLGDYPAKVIAKPTDYDRKLIQKMAEAAFPSFRSTRIGTMPAGSTAAISSTPWTGRA